MKKKNQITTIFDLPMIEMKDKLSEMKDYIYNIIESDKFVEISTKVSVPVNATKRDIDKLIKDNAPKKIKSIIELLCEDNFEDIMHIGALLFCEDYKLYVTKSFNQIVAEFQELSKSQMLQFIGFFRFAGR